MNYANISKSKRLQRVLEVLQIGRKVSTRTIQELADTCAPGTCVSELRNQGFVITCERKNGVYFYELLGQGKVAA